MTDPAASDRPVVTRFAPSPTGFLHIGGARTALYNWLFAKHHAQKGAGGTFLLRIEDTDRKRSTQDAVDAILNGLTWLGLDWDGDAISQFARADAHRAAAERLLAEGKAYRCYCTPEELADMREKARAAGTSRSYDGRWRDRDPAGAPQGIDPVIRLKAPLEGETVIEDRVQGTVTVANDQLDDMILLRADGTPTYMLAVVVDDHDMGVTHVIRGDDHLTNAFRQTQLFKALGWETPVFAHIPLIHGSDGAKLSKRHGALGVEAYRDDGFLPEALLNYLLRLGWSHGDAELISMDEAIAWFDLSGVGKSPSRFDLAKLNSVNAHYLRNTADEALAELVLKQLERAAKGKLAADAKVRLTRGMPELKERAKNLLELSENAEIYAFDAPPAIGEKAAKSLDDNGKEVLAKARQGLDGMDAWSAGALHDAMNAMAETDGVKLGAVAKPLRAALTGRTASPSVFSVMDVLGRDESLRRIDRVLNTPA